MTTVVGIINRSIIILYTYQFPTPSVLMPITMIRTSTWRCTVLYYGHRFVCRHRIIYPAARFLQSWLGKYLRSFFFCIACQCIWEWLLITSEIETFLSGFCSNVLWLMKKSRFSIDRLFFFFLIIIIDYYNSIVLH